jgi:hypothetical protein
MHHLHTVVVPAAIAFCLHAAVVAQVKLVPSQYPTISQALAAAATGDTILVAAGTYSEQIVWPAVDGIRVVGEQGAASTVIDGGGTGTVVVFQNALTRATVLAGFTIRNGFLSATHNDGAGIRVDNCSPTIRDNRITGNLIDGQYWNYGGGVNVDGGLADPLLLRNEIDNNEVRNGPWDYGAGIYVGSGAHADIVGNHIHDNRATMTNLANIGRGHGAGIYCAGTALIASNRIVGNTNVTNGWNYGGGVMVASSGVASVFNNTIVANSASGGIFNSGGGVYVDYSASATLRGNIIASNLGAGVFRASSGTGVVDCDADDVWGNSPDYANVTAGPNSISVDPQFVSATDTHLLPTSPCIDAIDAAHLTPVVAIDADGDPRRIDADLDGGATNGARLDIGADEVNGASLLVTGVPQLGSAIAWNIASAQPALFALGVGFDTGNLFLEPWGNLLLGPTSQVVAGGATPASLPLPIPNNPALRGVRCTARRWCCRWSPPAGSSPISRA